MDQEQITNRFVRGWISEAEFRAEMVKFYEREDAKDRVERIVTEAYATCDRETGDPIRQLVRQAVRIALADGAKMPAKREGDMTFKEWLPYAWKQMRRWWAS